MTFRYDDDQPAAVNDVSLTVRKGESLAVVGRNGSGKTTLLSLLPRFFEPESGSIRIDDTDIRDVPLDELRKQISVVTQEAVVFPGTIAENIAYANPDRRAATTSSAAAELAYAHDFIAAKTRLATTSPSPASAANSAAGNASASTSPAPSSATPRSSSSTRPLARSTPRANT